MSRTSSWKDVGVLASIHPIGVKKNAYIVDALCSFKGSLSFYLNGQFVGPCNSLVFWTVC